MQEAETVQAAREALRVARHRFDGALVKLDGERTTENWRDVRELADAAHQAWARLCELTGRIEA